MVQCPRFVPYIVYEPVTEEVLEILPCVRSLIQLKYQYRLYSKF
jgi:hypothetical protein